MSGYPSVGEARATAIRHVVCLAKSGGVGVGVGRSDDAGNICTASKLEKRAELEPSLLLIFRPGWGEHHLMCG